MQRRLLMLAITALLVLLTCAPAMASTAATSNTWVDSGVPTGGATRLCYRESDAKLYAGSGNGHVYRYDGGTKWTDVGNPGNQDLIGIGPIAYNPVDHKLYAMAGNIYRYDGGTTWVDTGEPGSTTITSLAFNGADSKIYAGHGFGQVYCYNGGTSWSSVGALGGVVSGLAYKANDSKLYASAGSQAGVYRFDGGTNWVSTANPDGIGCFSLAYNGCDGMLYGGSENGHINRYDGTGWSDAGIAGGNTLDLVFNDKESTMYGGSFNGHVYRYDGGTTWTDTGNPGSSAYVECLAFNRADSGMYAAMDNGHVYAYGPAPNPPVPPADQWKSTFYFAEGYTGANFQEYATLSNPNAVTADAWITCIFADGTSYSKYYSLVPTSRLTVDINQLAGAGKDVSMRVVSTSAGIVAERPMYFNYAGKWTGGSDAVGAVGTSRAWYFAEGNTLPEFDQYVTVLNPGGTPANLTFHYMVEGEGERVVSGRVNPTTRATFKTVDQIGANKNVSLYLESDQGMVAERPMYFDYRGLAGNDWTGGHDVVGTNSPNTDWYFAEGTTRKNSTDGSFETWLCLQNPQTTPIKVTAIYQLAAGQGSPVKKTYTVPGLQRLTVSVNAEIGAGKDCGVHLSSASPFIAERPMYFDYHGKWTGGHDVLGANSSAGTWFFAEGTTRSGFEEWLCLQNPGSTDAHAAITYYTAAGRTIQKNWTVKANTRLTVSANSDTGPNQDISARISADAPVIVERPMYFDFQGWNGGHDVVGFVPSP